MKKIIRTMVMISAAVLWVIMTAGAASEVTPKVVPSSNGTYSLAVYAESDTQFGTAELVLSYDNTVVIPINPADGTDVEVTTAERGTSLPFETELALLPVMWRVAASTTAFKATVWSEVPIKANEEVLLYAFRFRLATGQKLARDTFRVESDLGEGSVLAGIYGGQEAQNGAAIFIGADTYAATDGRADTVSLKRTDITAVKQADKIMVGDTTGDGTVNILDAIYLLQHLAAPDAIPFTGDVFKAADCELDGVINVMDAISLMQYLANNEIGFD